MEFLSDVKEKRIERLTITINTQTLTEDTVSDLSTMLDDSPGTTRLFFQLNDGVSRQNVLLQSKGRGVNVHQKLVNFLDTEPSVDYFIN